MLNVVEVNREKLWIKIMNFSIWLNKMRHDNPHTMNCSNYYFTLIKHTLTN